MMLLEPVAVERQPDSLHPAVTPLHASPPADGARATEAHLLSRVAKGVGRATMAILVLAVGALMLLGVAINLLGATP